jgi:hypothetical protein
MLFGKSPDFCGLPKVFFVPVQSELILKMLFGKSPKMSAGDSIAPRLIRTDWSIDRADWLMAGWTGRMDWIHAEPRAYRLNDWMIEWLNDYMIACPIDWSDWLIDWLIGAISVVDRIQADGDWLGLMDRLIDCEPARHYGSNVTQAVVDGLMDGLSERVRVMLIDRLIGLVDGLMAGWLDGLDICWAAGLNRDAGLSTWDSWIGGSESWWELMAATMRHPSPPRSAEICA